MENEKEVKNLQDSAEQMFDKLTGATEPAQENSPESVQTDDAKQNEDNSVKTGIPASVPVEEKLPETVPYKRFQEINQREKEAREQLKAKETEALRYSKLLDDPEVYAKWLKQQGYSDAHVAQAMAEKGYQAPQNKQAAEQGNQAQAIAERACAKLGWDINRLNAEQKAYINDSVSLTMAIIQESVGPMIDQRFGPLEQMQSEMSMQKQFNTDEMSVQKIASEEFPEADWEDVIKPAISKFLADLDEKDPQRLIKLTYEDIYYRATRPLLKELNESKGRQEVRNTNKANLRPLGTGVTTKTGEPVQKGKSAREEAESFLETRGVR